ncbi:hypothetical protein BKA70DRAFT_1441747 [Coprinopsis sp. MPI-PUGE-AT-0042]|nr:hypothetical protein BKA70DRAFT_1441747 [Coprinopsis sp. MPI-PUGE-AT-0042]
MFSTPDAFAQPTSSSEVIIQGDQVQAPGNLLPASGSRNGPIEAGSQDLAAFFADFLSGRSVDPSLPPQFEHNALSLPPQELLSSETQSHRLTPPQVPRTTTNNIVERETLPLQDIIQEQQNQLEELRQQMARSEQRSAYYREKAATFKALYAQQQAFSEKLMASLVHLRHSTRPQGTALGQSNAAST